MTDHFAALAQPRRPWLDAGALRESFHRAAALHHPDAAGGGGERFAALNAAHTALREPAARLRHLLALEAPALLTRAAPVPPALAELFMQLAGHRHTLDAFRQKETAAASPLARALLASEKTTLHRALETALAQLDAAHETALAELRTLDAAWDARDDAALENLASLQARFAFLAKWSAQLREDVFRLRA